MINSDLSMETGWNHGHLKEQLGVHFVRDVLIVEGLSVGVDVRDLEALGA